MDIFEKTQTQENSKLKQKTQTQAKRHQNSSHKTISSAISLQILNSSGEKIKILLVKSQLIPRFLRFFSQSLLFVIENSSLKLNFQQIHLIHLPKPGPISKPEDTAVIKNVSQQRKRTLILLQINNVSKEHFKI